MANDVQIILTAVDKASAVLKQTDTASEGLGKSLKTLATSAAVAAVAYKGFDILKTTITDTVKYAETVRDLSRALGINAEEASTLIQIADDLKIDQKQLEVAFRYALTQGIQPSVEGLKDLGAQYKQIKDPVEKAQFAMEKFGVRGGLEMQKILELTSQELDEMAQSAKDAGLVLSGESVQAARDFEIGLDELTDTVEGLKTQVGIALIPVLNDAMTALSSLLSIGNDVRRSMAEHEAQVLQTAESYDEYSAEMDRAIKATFGLGGKIDILTEAEYNNQLQVIKAAAATQGITADMNEQIKVVDQLTLDTEEATEAVDEQAIAEAQLKSELEDLKNLIAGPVGEEYDKFTQKSEDLRQKEEELRLKILELEGMEYLTDEQKAELDGLYTDIEEVSTAMTANADAHDEATKRILFNLLQQQLAIDGWTNEEFLFLQQVANSWGLIDDRTLEATEGMQAALADFAASGDIDAAIKALTDVKNAALGIPTSIYIKIRTNIQEALDKIHELKGTGRQFGGPVSGGQPYIVGEAGPELFVPSSSGTVINNYNLTAMYQNRDRQSLAMDIKMLAAMYG